MEAPPPPAGVILHRIHMMGVLKKFPNLKAVVQKDVSRSRPIPPPMKPAHDRRYEFMDILWVVAEFLPWYEMLRNLETWLELYPKYRTRAFGKKIISDFFNFYAEVEFYHALRLNGFDPTLNPKVAEGEKKNVDFGIEHTGRPYLVEVFVPSHSEELDAEFETITAGFYDPDRGIGPKNKGDYSRAAVHIAHEVRHHFNGVDPAAVAAPVVLAMNITYAYPEVTMGESLPADVELPPYIAGVLLYDTRKKQSRFYPNPVVALDVDTVEFFAGLMARAWEQAQSSPD